MNNFADRLRSEREGLGLSQEEFGLKCGVKKLAQFNYEKGERQPDAKYMAALTALGIDVVYLLTGDYRSVFEAKERIKKLDAEQFAVAEVPPVPNVQPAGRDAVLLDKFNRLDESNKFAVEAMINALLTKK